MPYVTNLEKATLENTNFRTVLFTGPNSQLVLMCLQPNEDIGLEVHTDVDQFIRIEKGVGKAVLDGQEYPLEDGSAVVIPAGTEHDIVNTSGTDLMKIYTVYSPAEHPDKVIDVTKQRKDEEKLKASTEELQATSEELEATNEELKATNEEVVKRNRELEEFREFAVTREAELARLKEKADKLRKK